MKINSIINTCTNIATIVIAICAIVGLLQTTESLKETANINKMATQYYSAQNALTRPIFRIEQSKSLNFTDFSRDGWTLPFNPEDVYKDITIFNDGAWIKSVQVSIETYLMTAYLTLSPDDTIQSTAMYIPVKDFYQFSQSGKVKGLIASCKSSNFQKKLTSQIKDVYKNNDGKHLVLCAPCNIYTIKYEDALGNHLEEHYSMEMEITGKESELEHNLMYSKELFKGRVFTSDDFDISTIIKEYGEKATILQERYADKGYIRDVFQESRPVFEKKQQ
ncbi:MAG: hypothetical protein IKL02_06115 [Kiritimatiellae bacterium]|nr:hypothetical protein [Kiritimatiellia bacterium]